MNENGRKGWRSVYFVYTLIWGDKFERICAANFSSLSSVLLHFFSDFSLLEQENDLCKIESTGLFPPFRFFPLMSDISLLLKYSLSIASSHKHSFRILDYNMPYFFLRKYRVQAHLIFMFTCNPSCIKQLIFFSNLERMICRK